MKKSKINLPPGADTPEDLTVAAPSEPRTWVMMKKRPHFGNAPEKPATPTKRKKSKHHAECISKGTGKKNPQQSLEEKQFVDSLMNSELGLLISLKQLAEKRAETIRQSTFANKFDLRILRALGFVLLEHMKEECKKASILSEKAET